MLLLLRRHVAAVRASPLPVVVRAGRFTATLRWLARWRAAGHSAEFRCGS
jgi:hypothetical protein